MQATATRTSTEDQLVEHVARLARKTEALDDFAALVVATLGTDAMLHAWLLTVWTGHGLWHPQGIVCSAFAATRF